MKDSRYKLLEKKADELRKSTFNLAVKHKDMHIASGLSMIDLIIGLYEGVLQKEDKFILSKGHGCISFYALLEEKGYNPKIIAHPDIDIENGINCTTGSLGHGLPIGTGMAMARKLKQKSGKIYVLMGDGECQEGSVWESLNIAAHHKLDNLVGIIDYNKIQALDKVENILSLGNLRKKIEAFDWHVSEINGHYMSEIITALDKESKYNPHMIIANTIKGKGLSFMENDPKWQSRFPSEQELEQAYKDLKIK